MNTNTHITFSLFDGFWLAEKKRVDMTCAASGKVKATEKWLFGAKKQNSHNKLRNL